MSGPVEVFHGSQHGPDPGRHSELDQDSPGVPGEKEEHSQFGTALDAGDANGDGYADVAVGTPVEADDGGGEKGKSTVTVLHGGSKGLTGRGARVAEEPSSSAEAPRDSGETIGNRFGDAVRMGDTNGDGKADLAIGAPRTEGFAGALWIYPAQQEGWPAGAARSYGPRDFGDPKAPDDEEIGASVR
ncbi:hypothetical protein OG946_31780 [Streptomyces sp. NBC_01808]|uniref:FG-GAP repeat protein n=1 Tax=Streptomyces sp. NBC_01808 TaxID=2975947 RepID=UPI002DD8A7DA|nr:FG-GAP repeat protein [Streptomyces sp. NBC_01808]WSA41557.1 hypothetical protein OG946_31780 [Streptomyces sp. NBC_01808]